MLCNHIFSSSDNSNPINTEKFHLNTVINKLNIFRINRDGFDDLKAVR